MSCPSPDGWKPILDPETAREAIAVGQEVAARLRDPQQAHDAAQAALAQTAFPEVNRWQPMSVAQGNAGLAILYGYLQQCFPDKHWEKVAHRHLEEAARGAQGQPYQPLGLFSGLGGLAFAAWYLSCGGVRYRKLIAAIEEEFLPRAAVLAGGRENQQSPVSVSHFDLISGLAGIGAYLLGRRHEPTPAATLQGVLASLVGLTEEDAGLPRWHTPPALDGGSSVWHDYPEGNLNCGLAHGIPGPLGIMALAYGAGVRVTGLPTAIERAADWLVRNRFDDAWGVNWPTAVPLERKVVAGHSRVLPGAAASAPFGPSRTAWCYGSPGIARALWLAGEALDRSDYRDLALGALEAVFRRPWSERSIYSPTFCHGVAGLLQITLRFAHATGQPSLREAAVGLVGRLLDSYVPDSRLGFHSLEPQGRRVDQPGLLDGAPGIALVLLAAATPVPPTWDRLFLLS